MKKIKVIAEWASDGTVGVMMEEDLFAGHGDTLEAAIADMRDGVKFYVETAKEENFPVKPYLTEEYQVEVSYDIQSMLKYARNYMTDAGLEKITGVNRQQIGRYANGNASPRPSQVRKILEGLQRFGAAFSAIAL